MRRQPFSRHAGFFASLQRVEDRLASDSEQHQEQNKSPPPPTTAAATATATTRGSEASPFSHTMTASPLLFLDPAAAPAAAAGSAAADSDSSGPALDFLTAATEQDQCIQQDDEDDDDGHDGGGEDIARLMALLGLSPPQPGGDSSRDDEGGGSCDCSGADGFLAKIVGIVGPKCDREKGRLDAWIRHYHRCEGGGCKEPARLAHLLLARASGDTAAVAFPASVKDFLAHDPPRQLTDSSE